MKFDWDELTIDNYTNNKQELKELVDDYIGFIRIGEICVDVLIRNYSDKDEKDKFAYSFDFYIANEDTGYGYKEKDNTTIAYDYADGTDLFDLSLSYEEFVIKVEKLLTDFILENDKKHSYSLVEKANKPLLVW